MPISQTASQKPLDNPEDYIKLLAEERFEQVLKIPFTNRYETPETFYVFWNPEGILLAFDTFKGEVNDGRFMYNWQENSDVDDNAFGSILSSASYLERGDQSAWLGNDEHWKELQPRIAALREKGTFLPVWIGRPDIRLLHYMDTDGKSFRETESLSEEINRKRIDLLPDAVQSAIAGSTQAKV